MHPLTRFIVRCTIAFVLIFLSAQIFNRFCLFSYRCQPFYFSKYWPRTQGEKSFSIDFEVNSVEFFAKNISKQSIVFRPSLLVKPDIFEKYIKRINCLCSHEYSLASGQSAKLRMEFFIDPKIRNEDDFQDSIGDLNSSTIKISYQIK